MIFGKTYDELRAASASWHPRFAWWPRRLDDGRTAWLQEYERRWFEDERGNWAADSSRWMYRQQAE